MDRSPRVVVALSGGVDSSVVAALCKAEGYSVAAVFYELWAPTPKEGEGWENNCCSLESYRDAQRVARQLGIPLYRANIANEFKRTVVDRFLAEYAAGRTPNPCVTCNAELRFGIMLERARKVFGADYLATGHYAIRDHVDSWRAPALAAEIVSAPTTPHHLIRAHDERKDQSFFLHGLGQDQLGHVIFPLGGRTKTDVRTQAAALGLPTASKHDSQEICFVKRGGVAAFLRDELGEQHAEVVTTTGKRVGSVANAAAVTLGQRRGLGALGPEPRYVVAKDLAAGRITVSDRATDPHLQLAQVVLERTNWIGLPPADGERLQARYRPLQQPFAATVRRQDDAWVVTAEEPVQVVAPGQSLVLHRGEEVVGGGTVRSCVSCATLKADAQRRTQPAQAA